VSEPIDNGGPAFPQSIAFNPNGEAVTAGAYLDGTGMSKRELLAALAMAGDFASQNSDMGVITNDMTDEQIDNRCEIFFRFADRMILKAKAKK
jgi:hypothetical protein